MRKSNETIEFLSCLHEYIHRAFDTACGMAEPNYVENNIKQDYERLIVYKTEIDSLSQKNNLEKLPKKMRSYCNNEVQRFYKQVSYFCNMARRRYENYLTVDYFDNTNPRSGIILEEENETVQNK